MSRLIVFPAIFVVCVGVFVAIVTATFSPPDCSFTRNCVNATTDVPVCAEHGFNARTFPSECVYETNYCSSPQYQYLKIANGPCFGQPTDKCAQNCTGLPVAKICAKYYLEPKTFDNQCSLDLFNCANADNVYVKAFDGACLFGN